MHAICFCQGYSFILNIINPVEPKTVEEIQSKHAKSRLKKVMEPEQNSGRIRMRSKEINQMREKRTKLLQQEPTWHGSPESSTAGALQEKAQQRREEDLVVVVGQGGCLHRLFLLQLFRCDTAVVQIRSAHRLSRMAGGVLSLWDKGERGQQGRNELNHEMVWGHGVLSSVNLNFIPQ